MTRTHGRCPRGQRLLAKVPYGHWKTLYDITSGTAPVQTFSYTASIKLTLSDHAMIVEIAE
jgi:hypothetical protein